MASSMFCVFPTKVYLHSVKKTSITTMIINKPNATRANRLRLQNIFFFYRGCNHSAMNWMVTDAKSRFFAITWNDFGQSEYIFMMMVQPRSDIMQPLQF